MIVTKPVASLTLDEIARGHADRADASGDRCFELGVSKLQSVGLQHRLVRLDRLLGRLEDCGRLIELLLRRNLLLDQLLLAPQVGLGLRKRCVVLRKLRLDRGQSVPGSRDHPG